MTNPLNAFDAHRGEAVLRNVASNDTSQQSAESPWLRVHPGQMPPLMFQVRMSNGVRESFPYGDIRRIRCRDAGAIQLETFSSPRTVITIEGRHLRELAELLGSAMVRWIEETDDRDFDRCESLPAITSIAIDHYTAQ